MFFQLPREIWVTIFGYLDFKSLQHNATRVCKEWFRIIRNDTNLSGELTLRGKCSSEISSISHTWKKLKILHLPDLYGHYTEDQKEHLKRFGNGFEWTKDDLKNVDLKVYKSLERVIIKHSFKGDY